MGIVLAIIAIACGGLYAWQELKPGGLPDGIASGNGRIEAVEIDIATKSVDGALMSTMTRAGTWAFTKFCAAASIALMSKLTTSWLSAVALPLTLGTPGAQ